MRALPFLPWITTLPRASSEMETTSAQAPEPEPERPPIVVDQPSGVTTTEITAKSSSAGAMEAAVASQGRPANRAGASPKNQPMTTASPEWSFQVLVRHRCQYQRQTSRRLER